MDLAHTNKSVNKAKGMAWEAWEKCTFNGLLATGTLQHSDSTSVTAASHSKVCGFLARM